MRRRGESPRAYRGTTAPPVFRLLPGGPAASLCASGELGGSFGETLTFTRASAKYAESGAGILTALTNNQPGVEPKGLLIEAAATNLCLHSADLSNAAWTRRGTAAVVANDATAPDGNAAADKITVSTVTNDVFQVVTGTVDAFYTPSFWVKRVSTSGTLRVGNPSDGLRGQWNIDLSAIGDGWVRITSGTQTGVTQASAFQMTAAGAGGIHFLTPAGTVTAHVWGCQVENGATFASSYIATAGTSATRIAETASVASTTWPNTAGEIRVRAAVRAASGNQYLLDSRSADNTGWALLISGAQIIAHMGTAGTATTVTSGILTWTSGQVYDVRVRWGGGNIYVYRDDVLVASNVTGTSNLPTFAATASIGARYTGTEQLQGWVNSIEVRR